MRRSESEIFEMYRECFSLKVIFVAWNDGKIPYLQPGSKVSKIKTRNIK